MTLSYDNETEKKDIWDEDTDPGTGYEHLGMMMLINALRLESNLQIRYKNIEYITNSEAKTILEQVVGNKNHENR